MSALERMLSNVSNSAMLDPLLSDRETRELFADESALQAMLEFEVALARAEELHSVVPSGTATVVAEAAARMEPDWSRLSKATGRDGHPVAELARQLRQEAGSAGDWVHWGATAQDVVDTALVMRLGAALDRFDARLREIVALLATLAKQCSRQVMAGRTRSQQAVPVTFGLKAAGWLMPLVRHRQRLVELRPRVLVVQFGGAAGTLALLKDRGVAVTKSLAQELGLGVPAMPWHSQRDNLAELAGWLSLVTASLAKIGQDLVLMAQTEVAEVNVGETGESSVMPHKANPVRPEVMVSIGRANADLLASMHHAVIHEHERSGSAWTLEWLTLPKMALLAGSALGHARSVLGSVSTNPRRMLENVEAGRGLALSEAALAELATRMPTQEARRVVAEASRAAVKTGSSLVEVLQGTLAAEMDHDTLGDPAKWLGSTEEFVQRALDFSSENCE